ncbi:MAG: hypothetical protein K2X81_04760 [Candidatus Obscuribacterales bacterium]|nr:hypothetical protein [Candidatus Obscuribacterales bacterium]
MADVDEKSDRRQVESRVLESQPEAQAARVAGAADVKAVQALNQNAHIGEHDKPFASMCLKTLKAIPSAQQERGWYRNLPRFNDDSVIPRIYFKLGK